MSWEKHFFHQILCKHANMFMAGFKEEIFEKSHFQLYIWLRYLHDIFCIWSEGHKKLKEFYGFLNNLYAFIKFTTEYFQK